MIRRDNSTVTDAALEFEGGGVFELNYLSGVVFTPGSPEAIEAIRAFIQDSHDERTTLNQLPVDDPDRTTDPARPELFWDGPGQPGNTDLVSRSSIYKVFWDGARYQYTSVRARWT